MATVAGILLDHVHDYLTYSDFLVLVGKGHRSPEVPKPLDALLRVGDLLAPRIPRIFNYGRIGALHH